MVGNFSLPVSDDPRMIVFGFQSDVGVQFDAFARRIHGRITHITEAYRVW